MWLFFWATTYHQPWDQHAWKACIVAILSRVRILLFPPKTRFFLIIYSIKMCLALQTSLTNQILVNISRGGIGLSWWKNILVALLFLFLLSKQIISEELSINRKFLFNFYLFAYNNIYLYIKFFPSIYLFFRYF